jgi:hypothetical protein
MSAVVKHLMNFLRKQGNGKSLQVAPSGYQEAETENDIAKNSSLAQPRWPLAQLPAHFCQRPVLFELLRLCNGFETILVPRKVCYIVS